jgi:hypothetical protein
MRTLRTGCTRRGNVLVVTLLGTLVAAVGIGYAAIPSSDGVIHGCYTTASGALRIIDAEAGDTCTKRETPLNWSQQGPPGPTQNNFTVQIPSTNVLTPVLTLPNGLPIIGRCDSTGVMAVFVGADTSARIDAAGSIHHSLNTSGGSFFGPVFTGTQIQLLENNPSNGPVSLNVIVRDASIAGNPFDRLDLLADGRTCTVSGMIIPGS